MKIMILFLTGLFFTLKSISQCSCAPVVINNYFVSTTSQTDGGSTATTYSGYSQPASTQNVFNQQTVDPNIYNPMQNQPVNNTYSTPFDNTVNKVSQILTIIDQGLQTYQGIRGLFSGAKTLPIPPIPKQLQVMIWDGSHHIP